ncbi:MAG: hypothetical protein ACFFFB_26445 [Candidatus Heimdallarchaeota archaeon]
MTVELSPLVHIEISVNDAEEAFQLLNKTLGAIFTDIIEWWDAKI